MLIYVSLGSHRFRPSEGRVFAALTIIKISLESREECVKESKVKNLTDGRAVYPLCRGQTNGGVSEQTKTTMIS